MRGRNNPFTEEERQKGRDNLAKAQESARVNGPPMTTAKWLKFRLAQISMRPGISEKFEGQVLHTLAKLHESDRKVLQQRKRDKPKIAAAKAAVEAKTPTVTSGLAQRIAAKNPQTTLEQ